MIKHDLTSSSGEVLKNSLVYKDSSGKLVTLSDTPTLVYTGVNNQGSTLKTSVTWNDAEGILLMINDKVINGIEYETNIIWSIEE